MTSGQPAGQPSRPDKRDALLQAAWKLIRHYGYGKTTISDIARTAGVGKGTVYLYFRSKEEIMVALVDRANERITRELEEIASRDDPALDRLRECLLHRVLRIYDLVHRYPHGEDVIASIKPAIVEHIDRHVCAQGRLLEGILDEGCASGELVVEDAEAVGQALAGLFELLTPPYYRYRSRKALERFADQVVDIVLRGLASTPRPAAGRRAAAGRRDDSAGASERRGERP